MNNVSAYGQCANCGACIQICPTKAIRVNGDGLFYQVEVDASSCINCGKCVNVCPLNGLEQHKQTLAAWYGANRDPAIVRASSSGGAFSAFAEQILEQGGVVFGASFSDDQKQVVFRSTDQVPLERLRRSKYTESLTEDCFCDIKAQLARGRKVLFCGTPCQTAGLLGYLGGDDDNLITCDFICGGLASHQIYQSYLQKLEGIYRSKVSQVNFRPKTLGWDNYAIRIDFENGASHHSPAELDVYYRAFLLAHYSVRELCLNCPFSNNHCGDLILADFWKYKELTDVKENKTGLSLVIANTEKGVRLVEQASARMEFHSVDVKAAAGSMVKKEYSDGFLKRRAEFLDCVTKDGLSAAAKYLNLPVGLSKAKIQLKSVLKNILWGNR